MTNILTTGVAGTDGVVPVHDPNGLFKIWSIKEIYLGEQGENRYVPNIGDGVVDLPNFAWYEVTALNQITLMPTLKKIDKPLPDQVLSDADMLLGVGPGDQPSIARVYIDKSVTPHTLSVDKRLRFFGTMATSVKIFRGSNLTGNEKVISAMYNQSGVLLGQEVPLELAAVENFTNRAVKCVPTCYTTEDLPDGEVVTVVAYSDDGHVVSKKQLLVENTGFIASADSSVKFVTGISLESPFMSAADPHLLKFPMNVPLIGLSLIGVVHYSDGGANRMPVDQTKFSVFGFNDFIASVVGQTRPLTLTYKLSENEIVYGATVGPNNTISESYQAVVDAKEGQYTPKLFGYPVWVDDLVGYRLEWWMYDMDRRLATLATPFVKYNTNAAPFDPLGYGRKQTLSVSVNMKDINPANKSMNFVQIQDVILRQPGNALSSNWAIGFSPNQEIFFGEGNKIQSHFINQNLSEINITCGETDMNTWLERLYYMTKPLTDQDKEAGPPKPNYFSICTKDWSFDYPIEKWNEVLPIGALVPDHSTLFIKFFKRTADTDIQLSIAGVPVHRNP